MRSQEVDSLLVQAEEEADPVAAAASYELALSKDPLCARAQAGLGQALQRMGRHGQALPHLAKAMELGCDGPEVLIAIGNCRFAAGRFDLAEAAFRRALAQEPNDPRTLVLLAHARLKRGDDAEAERLLREAVSLDPESAEACDLLAFLLPQTGRFEEAKQFAVLAARLRPDNVAYAVRYVYAGKLGEQDSSMIDTLERLSRSPNLSPSERIRLEYGLAKANEDLERYQESVQHYVTANALSFNETHRRTAFNAVQHKQEIDFLIRTFSPGALRERRKEGTASELPVFIVGMMRSGTTLTEQILSSHPKVGGAGELPFWVEEAPKTIGMSAHSVRDSAQRYLRLLASHAPDKPRVCDKMPQNYVSIGPIHCALPQARFIHCKRNPKDTCLSIFTIPFTYHPPFAYSMRNIAETYRQYQRVMEHWKSVLPEGLLLEIEYEELVANPEPVTRRMIDFLGLEWDDACLAPQANQRLVNTPSRWQVRQPIYKSSVARWQKFMPWLAELCPDWELIDAL